MIDFRANPQPTDEEIDDIAIEVERTEEFYKIARTLNDFIRDLPLTKSQNERLIELTIQQVLAAEHGAYNQGCRMGAEFARFESNQRLN